MKKNQPFEAASPPTAGTTKKRSTQVKKTKINYNAVNAKDTSTTPYECTQLPLYQLQIFCDNL